MHNIIPIIKGIIKDKNVINQLLVSFFIVNNVVEHGQCINENKIVLTAVIQFQPFSINMFLISNTLPISFKLPFDEYAIIAIGRTISFAGDPKINAISIIPSNPIILANGSKKSAQRISKLISSKYMFAINQIIAPAGAAIAIALPKTNIVLSNIDRIITLKICGLRYEGISRIKEEGMPFSAVIDNILVTKTVKITLIKTQTKTAKPAIIELSVLLVE